MPIQALRLMNPGGRPRRKSASKSRPRDRKGHFIKIKKTRTSRSAPKGRARRVVRVVVSGARRAAHATRRAYSWAAPRVKRVGRKSRAGIRAFRSAWAKQNPRKRRRYKRNPSATLAVVRKAAKKHKRGVSRKTTAAAPRKRRAATRKRSQTVAKTRKRSKRRGTKRVVRRRKRRVSATTRRKISRGLKRRYRAKRSASTRPRRRRRRRTSYVRPVRRRRRRRGARRYRATSRRFSKQSFRLKPGPGRKTRRYRLRRTTMKSGRRRYYRHTVVQRNPINALKKALPIYGGFLAAKILTKLAGDFLVPKLGTLPEAAKQLLPAGLMFIGATMLAPKLLKGKAKLLEGLQMGATLSLLDTIVKQFIAPQLPTAGIMGTIRGALSGYDDMGVQGYGYGSYIADPRGYSLPPAHATMEPGVGLDAHEAMALDEYVSDVGYDVNEALADSEVDYMQRGGAGGTLAHSVFSI